MTLIRHKKELIERLNINKIPSMDEICEIEQLVLLANLRNVVISSFKVKFWFVK